MTETVGRKRKKNGFTQISNALFEDPKLSWKAKGILGYLLSRPNNWKINKTDLYKRATEGRDAMQKGLNELRENGYLHVYPNYENGKLNGWIWEYDDTPFMPEVLNSSTTENQQETGEIVLNSSTTENQYDRNSERQKTSTYNNTSTNNTNNNKTKAKKNKISEAKNSPDLEVEFEQFWDIYPRRVKREPAFNAFKKARKVKKVPYETIINGLYRYIKYLEENCKEEEFITHASTWLNQQRWEDNHNTTIKKKPKNAIEYMQQKYGQDGGNHYESYGNRNTFDHYPTMLPESVQRVRS